MDTIRVIAVPTAEESGAKTIVGDRAKAVLVELDTDRFRKDLVKVAGVVESVLQSMKDQSTGLCFRQIAVGLEVSAEGGVTLIGTLRAGAKAAITLTFERR